MLGTRLSTNGSPSRFDIHPENAFKEFINNLEKFNSEKEKAMKEKKESVDI